MVAVGVAVEEEESAVVVVAGGFGADLAEAFGQGVALVGGVEGAEVGAAGAGGVGEAGPQHAVGVAVGGVSLG